MIGSIRQTPLLAKNQVVFLIIDHKFLLDKHFEFRNRFGSSFFADHLSKFFDAKITSH